MTDSVEKLSARVALLADKVGYEMHNFDCGQIDNTVIDPETGEITTNFTLEQVIRAVTSAFNEQIASAVATAKQEALLLAHPVNSYYWSSEATDPAELFGGTWVAVIDKFILAAGPSYTAGTTGGNASHTHTTGDHTLTVSEMPSHNHVVKIFNSNNETGTAMGATGTGWKALSNGAELSSGTVTWHDSSFTTVGSGYGDTTGNAMLTGGGGPHSHGDTGSASNLPPYEVAYCWRRTA